VDTRRSLESADALERLGRRIERIVDSIETISVQTSMLAVSGSVEAARAGDSGRGFAVVSGNIRNLAQDSAENTDRVKDMLRGIQDRIAGVRRDLEHVATSSEAELQRGRALPAALLRARDEVDSVRSANEEIETGATAIATALQEVAQGGQQIASAAEQAARASSEAASAARQQARGAEDLAAAVEEIASLADALQNAEA
jgi:methyl-accepting chemotaxis protein